MDFVGSLLLSSFLKEVILVLLFVYLLLHSIATYCIQMVVCLRMWTGLAKQWACTNVQTNLQKLIPLKHRAIQSV